MPEHSIFKFFLFLLTTVQALFVHPQTPFSLPTNDRGPVPGSSPVRYYADPTTFLYKIDKLDIESYCGVKLWGAFLTNITNAHLSMNITTHFNSGKTGVIGIDDAFKGWADVVQNGTKQEAPRKGRGTVEATTLLLGGWIPEANYTAVMRVEAEEGLVWELWTAFEMKVKE